IGLVRKMVAAGLMLVLVLCASSFGSWRTRAAVRTGPVSAQEDVHSDALQVAAATPTLLVATTADTDDGSCNAANCTLREAIKAANTQAGDDVIGFTAEVTGSIEILTALPAITTNLQIVGPGADKLTLKRSAVALTPNFGVFRITAGTVIISGLTLRGGSANTSSQGGGISNSGNLTLNNCVV